MDKDFFFRQKKGIEYIEKFCSNDWTDYNTHDPGITILEYLCYALTDLSSRTDLPIRDLLAAAPEPKAEIRYSNSRPLHILHDGAEESGMFHYAEDILPSRPLTINDFRKILIDIPKIRNAWLTPVEQAKKTPGPDNSTKQHHSIKGLYRVDIEFIPEIDKKTKERVLEKAGQKLAANRNLCEDFDSFNEAEAQDVYVEAAFYVTDDTNVEDAAAIIAYELEKYISPSVKCYSLEEMELKGKILGQIFNGPKLKHGFIDDVELDKAAKKKISKSEIGDILFSIKGVTGFKRLILSDDQDLIQGKDSLKLTGEKNYFNLKKYNFIFIKNHRQYFVENSKLKKDIKEKIRTLKSGETGHMFLPEELCVQVPDGNGRDVINYTSIQYHFPACYGIGHDGLADSASNQRKAQAKQLKAYLLIFEQFMANYFAQLAHIKYLFSMDDCKHSYFVQKIHDCPGIEELLCDKEKFLEKLQKFAENKSAFLERRNRFLDHLLARFSESMATLDFDNTAKNQPDDSERLLTAKQAFLKNYVSISRDRAGAFNYFNYPSALNISGLEERVRHILGMDGRNADDLFIRTKEKNEFNGLDEYRFYLKDNNDKILLCSKAEYLSRDEMKRDMTKVRILGRQRKNYHIGRFGSGERTGKYSFNLVDYNSEVTARHPEFYDSKKPCEHAVEQTLRFLNRNCISGPIYILEHILFRKEADDSEISALLSKAGVLQNRHDPYSFQISVILPKCGPYYKTRDSVENLIREQTPAHILPSFIWLEGEQMRDFESAYYKWAASYATELKGLKESSKELIKIFK